MKNQKSICLIGTNKILADNFQEKVSMLINMEEKLPHVLILRKENSGKE